MSEQSNPEVLVIERLNQQPSNFILDGAASEDTDLPTNISAPNAWKIRNKCKIKVMEEYKGDDGKMHKREVYKNIRYIKGCDEIYVDRQKDMGIEPNPTVDVIWVLNGKLTVVNSGSEIGLYKFLKAHEENVDNPDRPDGAVNSFCEISTAVTATQDESILDDEIKVLEYLSRLKTKTAGGKFEYNTDALEFLCSLFKLPKFDDGYQSEAWVAIATFAKENPTKFLKSIASQYAKIESEVSQAMSRGIINIDEKQEVAVFTLTSKVITEISNSLTNEERKEKLIDFLSNPLNRFYYDELTSELHNAKTNAASVIQ